MPVTPKIKATSPMRELAREELGLAAGADGIGVCRPPPSFWQLARAVLHAALVGHNRENLYGKGSTWM